MVPPGELQVNAGVVWLAGNNVWFTPERIRGEVLTTMRYTNRRLPYLTTHQTAFIDSELLNSFSVLVFFPITFSLQYVVDKLASYHHTLNTSLLTDWLERVTEPRQCKTKTKTKTETVTFKTKTVKILPHDTAVSTLEASHHWLEMVKIAKQQNMISRHSHFDSHQQSGIQVNFISCWSKYWSIVHARWYCGGKWRHPITTKIDIAAENCWD